MLKENNIPLYHSQELIFLNFLNKSYVVLFNLTIGPLVFYNLQKTKLLQLATTLMRWIAFITMITLAINKIVDNNNQSVQVVPVLFDIKGLDNFSTLLSFKYYSNKFYNLRNSQLFRSLYLCIYVSPFLALNYNSYAT